MHPPAPTAALLKVGAVLTSTLHQADALQVQLTETMHARTRLITELKEVVAPLCKREQELYNRNTVLAINISLADVQQVMCSLFSQCRRILWRRLTDFLLHCIRNIGFLSSAIALRLPPLSWR